MRSTEPREHRTRLRREQERVATQLSSLTREARVEAWADSRPDLVDVGTATLEREQAQQKIERLAVRLQDIEVALARVEDGTYGSCEVCGDPIPTERLEILPDTSVCVTHAERRVG